MIKHLTPHTYAPRFPVYFFLACIAVAGISSIALASGRNGDPVKTQPSSNNSRIQEYGSWIRDNEGSTGSSDSYSFDPCDLKDVECEGEKEKGAKQGTERGAGILQGGDRMNVAGYSIGRYATLPTHEATVKAIYDAMPEIKDKFGADEYIKSKRTTSPVRGGMVERASEEYGVDMKLVLALMQNDSAFGTAGLGARTHNPGNIANRDDGHTHDYGNWEDGVRGVARWLAKNKN